MNDLITPYTAAILGLGLNEAAYMAEIIRGGMSSVDSGQQEAARALGMKQGLWLRRVVLPQAVPFIIPPSPFIRERLKISLYLSFAVSGIWRPRRC
ncbi:hypothetical protein SODG_001295 [Sodalis praecaptivus]|nr:hypothetical protein NVIRENTERO_02647 [Sodalis praecaptivus]